MKLLGSTESKITKDKNGENVPHLEVAELVIVACSLVNNDYQQDPRILHIFVPNKPLGSLLEISTEDLVGDKTADKITTELHSIVSKKSPKEFRSKELSSNENNNEIPKERYISPQERQQVIDELRLI